MKVHLEKTVTLQTFSQTNTMVVADKEGLVFIEPRAEVASRCTVCESNGVVKVERHRPFSIFLLKFVQQERNLLNEMFISLASKKTLERLPIAGEMGEEI